MQETETFDWPIGALHNGVVRIGRNTFLQSLIDSDGLPVYERDEQGHAIKTPAAQEVGHKSRDAMRREAELLKLTHPESRGFLSQLLKRLEQNDLPPEKTKK